MSAIAKVRVKAFSFVKHGNDNVCADKTIYSFVNVQTLEEFIGTRLELCSKFNIEPKALSNLFCKTRKSKTAKGWSIIKETNGTT